jgi:hypothetical protein
MQLAQHKIKGNKMASLETAYELIAILAEDFKNNEEYYTSPNYSEAQARKDFIDKFFIALGWDVNHEDQKDPYRQEVKVERGVSVHGAQRRADYSFSIAPNYRDPKFFVEAKKPSRQLESGDDYFQAIRYGWNTQNPLVVLTDFEELHILDSRFRPDIKSILNYCHQKYHYTEYLDKEKFKKIYYLFSREAVEDNSIDSYAAELPKPKGKKGIPAPAIKSFDQAFLDELDETRESLARAFKRKNNNLTSEELTEATQRVIDRLVFIRFLEDKLIEGERHISGYSNHSPRRTAWHDFIKDCRTFDAKYNGIVFKYHDIIDSGNFNPPDDKEFSNICADLSHVDSPYDFNFIPIHILGSIYERFLGKVVHATAKQVKVEEKPEVRKAGGVYYTPQYIVKYIVDNTVGKILRGEAKNVASAPRADNGKVRSGNEPYLTPLNPPFAKGGTERSEGGFGLTPKQITKLRFADISCGSGSFLITVFDTLLEYHGRWYQEHPKEAKADGCILKDGKWILSLRQKRDILLNNVYGVDIDYQAVEVTQLSLFLKLLEDETLATAHEMQTLFKERILPDLSKNIVCGNSLIGTDITDGELFSTPPVSAAKGGSTLDEKKINAMNFEDRFPHIFKSPIQGGQNRLPLNKGECPDVHRGEGVSQGFDAIVGNPPYVRIHDIDLLSKKYFLNKYATSSNQFDLYQLFYEKGLKLLNTGGYLSFITSNKFGITNYGYDLRNFIFDNYTVEKIVDLSNLSVFKEASTYPYILTIKNIKPANEVIEVINSNIQGFFNHLYLVPQNKILLGSKKILALNVFGTDKVVLDKIEKNYRQEILLVYRGRGTSKDLSNSFKKDSVKCITNKEINRYYTIQNIYYKDKFKYQVDFSPKLLMKKICFSLEITADFEGLINPINTVYVVKVTDSNYNLKYILGILNSKLLTYYARNKYLTTGMRGGYIELRVFEVSQLPIKTLEFSNPAQKTQHDKMVSLVNQMLEAKKKQMESTTERDKSFWENKCTSLDRQIDTLVYELYGLTEEEIKIVEGS